VAIGASIARSCSTGVGMGLCGSSSMALCLDFLFCMMGPQSACLVGLPWIRELIKVTV
jgi:hypothetical protein